MKFKGIPNSRMVGEVPFRRRKITENRPSDRATTVVVVADGTIPTRECARGVVRIWLIYRVKPHRLKQPRGFTRFCSKGRGRETRYFFPLCQITGCISSDTCVTGAGVAVVA